MSSSISANLVPPTCPPGYDVSGRVFVVTGGTQGLGLAVAKQLKQSGAIGTILVSNQDDKGKEVAKELSDESCACHFITADLSDANQVQQVIPEAVKYMEEKGIDVPITGLANVAATTDRGNLLNETAEGFNYKMNLNVQAPFLLTQAVAKHMIEHGTRGSIVNISSVAAHGGAPFMMAYSASKAALVNMTKNNAAELAHRGIRVNAINVGWTLTDNEDERQKQNMGDNWAEQANKIVPLGRILQPDDVATTVGFLLSDSAGMMSGSIVNLHPEFHEGILTTAATDRERNVG